MKVDCSFGGKLHSKDALAVPGSFTGKNFEERLAFQVLNHHYRILQGVFKKISTKAGLSDNLCSVILPPDCKIATSVAMLNFQQRPVVGAYLVNRSG